MFFRFIHDAANPKLLHHNGPPHQSFSCSRQTTVRAISGETLISIHCLKSGMKCKVSNDIGFLKFLNDAEFGVFFHLKSLGSWFYSSLYSTYSANTTGRPLYKPSFPDVIAVSKPGQWWPPWDRLSVSISLYVSLKPNAFPLKQTSSFIQRIRRFSLLSMIKGWVYEC